MTGLTAIAKLAGLWVDRAENINGNYAISVMNTVICTMSLNLPPNPDLACSTVRMISARPLLAEADMRPARGRRF
jgi:hypothetical protein